VCVLRCRLSSLRDLETLGLFMHDLNMYDCSRQMVMAGWQHASRIECSIEKVFLLESCSAVPAVTNVERRRRAVGLWVANLTKVLRLPFSSAETISVTYSSTCLSATESSAQRELIPVLSPTDALVCCSLHLSVCRSVAIDSCYLKYTN